MCVCGFSCIEEVGGRHKGDSEKKAAPQPGLGPDPRGACLLPGSRCWASSSFVNKLPFENGSHPKCSQLQLTSRSTRAHYCKAILTCFLRETRGCDRRARQRRRNAPREGRNGPGGGGGASAALCRDMGARLSPAASGGRLSLSAPAGPGTRRLLLFSPALPAEGGRRRRAAAAGCAARPPPPPPARTAGR